ncbi:hypothetical protein MJ8_06380 [Mesorhizobium sp. J8]|nr:hypothetical protein MJ8_06380 [Mesorhizobium sp. J8]
MTNELRDYLKSRHRELLDKITPLRAEIAERQSYLVALEAELADVEKSSAAIGMVNGVQTADHRKEGGIRRGTIKDYVVQVLSDYPDGLVALDILTKINERFDTEFTRTSLSPQLSRLAHDQIVGRRGLVWYLVKSSGPDIPSGPVTGEMAERLNAPDSKSGEVGSSKNTTASGGSNPPLSALSRTKESLLSGSNLFGPLIPLKSPDWAKKGG